MNTSENSCQLPLSGQKCVACEGGIPKLSTSEIDGHLSELDHGWRVVDGHHLYRSYTFEDFKTALRFTNQVGTMAEAEGHHPDILLGWGKVEITLWTHAVDGLTLNDFILASKVSTILD